MKGVYGVLYAVLLFRDILTILAGFWTILGAPPSFGALGADNVASSLWSAALIIGGFLSWYGRMRGTPGRNIEIVACIVVAVGFGIWGMTAAFQPDPTHVSYGVACGFGVAGCHSFIRGLLLAIGDLGLRK